MKICDEGTMNLLEAVVADAADEFEGGVREYLDAVKALKTINVKLNAVMLAYVKAKERVHSAAEVIRREYDFFDGKGCFDPQLDAKMIALRLIDKVFDRERSV